MVQYQHQGTNHKIILQNEENLHALHYHIKFFSMRLVDVEEKPSKLVKEINIRMQIHFETNMCQLYQSQLKHNFSFDKLCSMYETRKKSYFQINI
jgi:hypothetical protein